jgi:hypothetical protein
MKPSRIDQIGPSKNRTISTRVRKVIWAEACWFQNWTAWTYRSPGRNAAEQLATLLRSLTGRWMRFTRCFSPTSIEIPRQPAHLRDLRGPSFMLQIETIGCDPTRRCEQQESTSTLPWCADLLT